MGFDQIGEVDFPGIDDPGAIAFEITGKRFEPIYREGDIVIVSPKAEVKLGDRVAIKTKTGTLDAYMFGSEDDRDYVLKAIQPSDDAIAVFLPKAEVEWIGRIIWASQ